MTACNMTSVVSCLQDKAPNFWKFICGLMTKPEQNRRSEDFKKNRVAVGTKQSYFIASHILKLLSRGGQKPLIARALKAGIYYDSQGI